MSFRYDRTQSGIGGLSQEPTEPEPQADERSKSSHIRAPPSGSHRRSRPWLPVRSHSTYWSPTTITQTIATTNRYHPGNPARNRIPCSCQEARFTHPITEGLPDSPRYALLVNRNGRIDHSVSTTQEAPATVLDRPSNCGSLPHIHRNRNLTAAMHMPLYHRGFISMFAIDNCSLA